MTATRIAGCVFSAALSCMSVPAVYNLVKEVRFSMPFSLELVSHGIWTGEERSRRMATELFGAVFIALAFFAGQIWLASLAGAVGYGILAASLLLGALLFRPAPEMLSRSAFNITRFAAKYALQENKKFLKYYEKEMK